MTLDSANPVIKHGDTEAKVTLKAQGDASLGDFTRQGDGAPRERRRRHDPIENHRGQEIAVTEERETEKRDLSKRDDRRMPRFHLVVIEMRWAWHGSRCRYGWPYRRLAI